MEGLIAAPRTLDVQHFAKARATELLFLHSLIKTRKRKAFQEPDGSSLGDGDGITTHNNGDDGIDGIDIFGLSNTSTSLPRRLRRRTSSYVRRRRPLPWLYKKKKKPCISFSSLFEQLKKRRKQRFKKRLRLWKQNPAPNSDTAPSPRWIDEFLNIPFDSAQITVLLQALGTTIYHQSKTYIKKTCRSQMSMFLHHFKLVELVAFLQ
ncbi:hypothetical protein L7F22_056639 [Adiantum nelumboides]|nr:hypothetical protein [Adiantum nelumboides]